MEAGDHKISPKRLKRRRFSRTLRVGEKVGSWATLSPNIASPKVAEKYEIVIGDKRPTGEVKLKKEGHGYFVIEERDDQRFLLEAYVFTNRPLPQRKR